jgi:ABC-type lipoprotein release transport system permease subunit
LGLRRGDGAQDASRAFARGDGAGSDKMSASLRYILRNLARRRTRTVMGALGICLTLALLTAIQVGLDSVSISYIDLVALQAGKADLIITAAGGDAFNPQGFAPGEVPAQVWTNASLRGLSPRWFGVVQAQSRGEEVYAVLIGLDPKRERELDISGLVPEPVLEGEACAVSSSLAAKLKIKKSSRFTVSSPTANGEAQVRVDTILERQMLLPQQIRDYVVVPEAVARQVLSDTTHMHALAGAFRNPHSYYDARDLHNSVLKIKNAGAEIAGQLGQKFHVRLPKAAAITAFQEFTSPLRAVFGVFALLALTITGLLIYSLISVSVEERIREYAILRTLGAKSRDIFRLVLMESFLLCFLGVVPGVLGGAGFAALAVKLVSLGLSAKGGSIGVEISPTTLLLTLAGGAALSIGSALVHALADY